MRVSGESMTLIDWPLACFLLWCMFCCVKLKDIIILNNNSITHNSKNKWRMSYNQKLIKECILFNESEMEQVFTDYIYIFLFLWLGSGQTGKIQWHVDSCCVSNCHISNWSLTPGQPHRSLQGKCSKWRKWKGWKHSLLLCLRHLLMIWSINSVN